MCAMSNEGMENSRSERTSGGIEWGLEMEDWRAVERRVDAKLRQEGLSLRTCNYGSFWHYTLGDYYIINEQNGVDATHVNIEFLARKLGCLEPEEQIELDFGSRG